MTAPKAQQHRRSYSQLSDFLHCGWAFRLKRIKRIPERPSVWLIGGKAFHSATEDFDRACWQENDLSAWADHDQWIEAFHQHFDEYFGEARAENPDVDPSQWRTAGRKTKDKPRGEDLEWWRENGPIFVENYVKWRVENNHRLKIAALPEATVTGEIVESDTPAIEVEMRTPLGGVAMSSYADRVFEDTDSSELLIADMKSGSRTPDSPMQLATYSLQLEPIMRRPIVWGAFYDARKGTLHDPIDLTAFNLDNVGYIYRTVDKAAREGIFLPNIGSHCKACGLKESCIWQGNSEPASPQEA